MEKQQLRLLQQFENDSGWFHNNIDKLREQNFTYKFVAVFKGKPIASDKKLEVVIKTLQKSGKDPAYIFIEFVHPKGFTLLL